VLAGRLASIYSCLRAAVLAFRRASMKRECMNACLRAVVIACTREYIPALLRAFVLEI
jgi:hypothetical protein